MRHLITTLSKLIRISLFSLGLSLVSGTLIAADLTELKSIRIISSADSGRDFDTQLDIVFVFSDEIITQLPYTAFDWFSRKNEVLNSWSDKLKVLNIDAPAGDFNRTLELPEGYEQAIAVLLYAQHEDPVSEYIEVTDESALVLIIESWGVDISSAD